MTVKFLSSEFSVCPQIGPDDLPALYEQGFRSIICNRPDNEGDDQPAFASLEVAASAIGMTMTHLPVIPGQITDDHVASFSAALSASPGPVLGFCKSGLRAASLWALSQAASRPLPEILGAARAADIDISSLVRRMANRGKAPVTELEAKFEVVIVGGGAAGIAVAASLKSRQPGLQIALIDPSAIHYYQPGWTMVGGGIFQAEDTARTMASLIPRDVEWLSSGIVAFEPSQNAVVLEGGRVIGYRRLIVCPGLKIDWAKVAGLEETLGRNGVTSNYRYDLAPYTWELVNKLQGGRALFTQPPMPIKCAGAPQKAMYLSGDHWHRRGVLGQIDIQFHNAGGVLFGVKDYVPALEEYVKRYNADLNFFSNLVAVDGPARKAWFDVAKPDTPVERIAVEFDMMHVCPPQSAPDFIRVSPLADAAGWVDVDQGSLRHKTFDNIWSLGDVMNAPNAKTAAAARKQAPVVAANVVADIQGRPATAAYDGYGSCPLTVERGKIVLAEFGYGGALQPSFPKWLVDGTKPSRLAWYLKEQLLPPLYWKGMLRGREWMASPNQAKSGD